MKSKYLKYVKYVKYLIFFFLILITTFRSHSSQVLWRAGKSRFLLKIYLKLLLKILPLYFPRCLSFWQSRKLQPSCCHTLWSLCHCQMGWWCITWQKSTINKLIWGLFLKGWHTLAIRREFIAFTAMYIERLVMIMW